MWLDAIVLAVLAAFAVGGAVRGALTTALGIVSLAASYAAALVLAPILGPPLATGAGISEMLAIPLAGTGTFFVTFVVMGVVSKLVRRLARRRDGVRSPRDRFLGGALGAVRGGLVVLLLCWLALWADALRATGTVESVPASDDSMAAAITAEVVESGLEAALSEHGRSGRMAARMAARPAVALVEVQSVLEDSRVAAATTRCAGAWPISAWWTRTPPSTRAPSVGRPQRCSPRSARASAVCATTPSSAPS
jgi:uncharacterized membrane protein required for colicin V production